MKGQSLEADEPLERGIELTRAYGLPGKPRERLVRVPPPSAPRDRRSVRAQSLGVMQV
jgi:hypothetical protein